MRKCFYSRIRKSCIEASHTWKASAATTPRLRLNKHSSCSSFWMSLELSCPKSTVEWPMICSFSNCLSWVSANTPCTVHRWEYPILMERRLEMWARASKISSSICNVRWVIKTNPLLQPKPAYLYLWTYEMIKEITIVSHMYEVCLIWTVKRKC